MKRLTLLIALALLVACGGRATRAGQPAAEAPQPPARYTYRVVRAYPHAVESYTQGLFWADGTLWEGTGEYGHSRLQRLDTLMGRPTVVATLPRSEFGEGIALHKGRIYQLTWQSNTAHVYDAATARPLRDFRYAGEGWGLTSDGERLYMTDGSSTLYTVDPETFRRTGRKTVTCEGRPVPMLNELEWIEGRIWANVYTTDQIVVIDPATGRVEAIVDLAGLLPADETAPDTDVLNGIAYDPAAKRIFVTGKRWPKLYEIEILPQ